MKRREFLATAGDDPPGVYTFYARAEYAPDGVALGSVLMPKRRTQEYIDDKSASRCLGVLGIFTIPDGENHWTTRRRVARKMMALKIKRWGAHASDDAALRKLLS